MRAIFISYRRDDSEGQAGRLYDDLVRSFGEDKVFMDVADIELGRDFRRAIDEQVASCGVLLAVIGKDWIEAKDETGRKRLEDPTDFVRLETSSALKRDIPVIPVLVRGASMPSAEELPADLADLAYRNAVELTHARWDSDVQLLIKALTPYIETQTKAAPKTAEPPSKPAQRKEVNTTTSGSDVDRNNANSESRNVPRLGLYQLLLLPALALLTFAAFALKNSITQPPPASNHPTQPKNSIGNANANANTNGNADTTNTNGNSDTNSNTNGNAATATDSHAKAQDQPPAVTGESLMSKSRIQISYAYKDGDVAQEKILPLLEQAGYTAKLRPTKITYKVNALWFGNKIPHSYVQNIATILLNSGIRLQSVCPFRDSTQGQEEVWIVYDGGFSDEQVLTEGELANSINSPSAKCKEVTVSFNPL